MAGLLTAVFGLRTSTTAAAGAGTTWADVPIVSSLSGRRRIPTAFQNKFLMLGEIPARQELIEELEEERHAAVGTLGDPDCLRFIYPPLPAGGRVRTRSTTGWMIPAAG